MKLQYSLTSGIFFYELKKKCKKVQITEKVWSFALRGRGRQRHNVAPFSAFPWPECSCVFALAA